MAIAYLGYRVDSKQVATAEKRLDRMSGAAGVADKSANTLASSARRLAAQLGGVVAVMSAVRGAFNVSQQFQNMTNTLRGMGMTAEEAASTLRQVGEVANRTRAPLEATAQLYQRISIAGRDLGASSQDVLRFTENVGLALASAGVGANEARGALLQLSQAMAGGVVRAEEFNSILEGAFPIAQAAANGIDAAGGSVGRLRQLVIEGKVSSDQFFNAILSQTDELQEAFENTTPTISQAFSVLRNNLTLSLGEFDKATGASAALANGILAISKNLGVFVDVAKVAATVMAGFAASSIASATTAFISYIAQIGIATTATTVFTGAVRIARVAVAALGGPLGVVYAILGSVAAGMVLFGDEAEKTTPHLDAAAKAQEALNAALGTFSETAAPEAAAEAINLANTMAQEAKQAMDAAKAQIALAEARQAALSSSIDTARTQGLRQQADEQAAEARERLAAAENALAEAERARDRVAREVTGGPMTLPNVNVVGDADDRINDLAGSVDDLMGSMGGAAGAAGAMADGLGDAAKTGETLADKLNGQVKSAVDSVADAFGDFVSRGFKDFAGFARSVLDTFKNMLANMITMAAKNRITIALGLGGGASGATSALAGGMSGGGGLGGIFSSAMGSFGQGASLLGSGSLAAGFSSLAGGSGFLGGLGSTLGATFGTGGGLGGLFSIGANAATAGGGFMATLGAAAPVLGLATAAISLFVPKIRELDKGIRVTADGLDTSIEQFRKIETSRLFGLIKSRSTNFKKASDEVADPIRDALGEMQGSAMEAARVFGFGAGIFEDFSASFKVSLKGLSKEEKLKKVNEELAKMGDEFASLVPNFENMNDLINAANQAVAETAALGSTRFESQMLAAARRRGEITTTRGGPGFAEGQSLIRLQQLTDLEGKVEENTRQNNRLTQKMVDIFEQWEEVGIPRGPVVS